MTWWPPIDKSKFPETLKKNNNFTNQLWHRTPHKTNKRNPGCMRRLVIASFPDPFMSMFFFCLAFGTRHIWSFPFPPLVHYFVETSFCGTKRERESELKKTSAATVNHINLTPVPQINMIQQTYNLAWRSGIWRIIIWKCYKE